MKPTFRQSEGVTRHLTRAEVERLLSGEEPGGAADEWESAGEHLESCEACRARLSESAAGAELWSEAEAMLRGDGEARWSPDLTQSHSMERGAGRQSLHDQVLRLLSAPRHPEMLGRVGRYDIEKVIGSGGMGVVLKAHDSELNRPIAIKLLAPHLSHVAAARERFAREGRAAAAVVHEHVVAIHTVEADGTLPYLVMQYVPGRSLQARVEEDGPLGVEELLRIGMQAAAGLAAAHAQGLVHRDVKPANILLEDTVERAVLTDFGLARAIDDASLTQTGVLAGTPHYMSPEQATGMEIDARSDLFSLGGVLYFMATGQPPFRASGALAVLHRICREPHRPVWQRNREMPDAVCDVIDALLEKKPARRIATSAEVRDRLAELLSEAQRHGLGRRKLRWRGTLRWRGALRRRRVAVGAAATCLLLGAFAAAWWWNMSGVMADGGDVAEPASTASTSTAALDDAGSFDALVELEAAAAVREQESQFAAELGEALDELEAMSDQPVFLRSPDDEWRAEVDSIEAALHELEARELEAHELEAHELEANEEIGPGGHGVMKDAAAAADWEWRGVEGNVEAPEVPSAGNESILEQGER